jgi:valyl-tRNA synthetase
MKEISKKYDPKDVEKKWYDFWLSKNYFTADTDSKKPSFSMVIPPPNVTGMLHIGHALNNTIQDIIARKKRMQGFNVLWLPGTDHAGIATHAVVEKELAKEKTNRFELGREKFIKRVLEWKEKYGNTILSQLKTMGCSCDWTRTRFTMDEGLSKAVTDVFIKLYKEGLIYRGSYIINWCVKCNTALSDIEVKHLEISGNFYHIRYPVAGSDDFVTVATTRPETMLGDTAVAVNPKDERWAKFIGKKLMIPSAGREIPVISDEKVAMDMGTGAVKVTPAHDPDDFDMGKRHKLPEIKIMDLNGKMNENAGKYAGKDRFQCRRELVKELKETGFIVKIEEYQHSVGHCDRCDTVTEPLVSLQWFVKMKPLAEPAIKAVKEGRIKFHPDNWANDYFNWMENIRDWCISRQLWWGHRLPVWYCLDCKDVIVTAEKPEKCPKCFGSSLKQDPDVLDTWFSSALWPFSTLGWPQDSKDLKAFYPTTVLSTGFDIIFFWVAKMIMMGIKCMNEVPFKDVYIHALIRDAEGKKMSKSKGNVIDPLVLCEQYGTDSLRFTMGVLAAQGRDICISEDRVEGSRNFTNKIWNASRFLLMNMTGFRRDDVKVEKLDLTLADRWIISRANAVIDSVTNYIDRFHFDKAAEEIYSFLWHDYCDWYIEICKPRLLGSAAELPKQPKGLHDGRTTAQFVLSDILEKMLKVMHPFMPFITEEIWQSVPHSGESIMTAAWPESNKAEINEEAEKQMELIKTVITSIRNIRNEFKVIPGAKIDVIIKTGDNETLKVVEHNSGYITELSKIANLKIGAKVEKPKLTATAVIPKAEIFVILEGVVDIEKEKERLNKEIEKLTKDLMRIKVRLGNEEFLQKAPVEVIAEEKAKQQEYIEKKDKLLENLRKIS